MFREPLDVFFRDFGVTVTHAGGSFAALFDTDPIEALGGSVSASKPMCIARTLDLTTGQVAVGTVIRVPVASDTGFGDAGWWGGQSFTVRGIVPDGSGRVCQVSLERAP